MTARMHTVDAGALFQATRQALVRVSDGLDASAVQLDTPLASLIFDSLVAVNFIAMLEAALGADELPFERWLAEHSERTDALTVGSLVDWLASFPEVGPGAAPDDEREEIGGRSGDG